MAGKSNITRTDYQAIVTAYREVGPNALRIARIVGKNRQTIGKALRYGWPELGYPPVHLPHRSATVSNGAAGGTNGASTSAASTSPATSTGTATGTDGLSAKQSAARRQEEDVIQGSMQNLAGSAIVTTKILQKLVEQAPSILSKIGGDGDDAISPREYVRLIRELSKVNRETSDALNRLMAAGRLNTGEAQSISETRHTGNVGLSVDLTPEAAADREKRFQHLLGIHARARAHVPGSYKGEEHGIIDVVPEATPSNDVGAGTPVAMAVLLERESITSAGENAAEAESNARLTLAARSMPAEQIERVIERARGKAEREGRAVGDVLEETLAAQPGRVR